VRLRWFRPFAAEDLAKCLGRFSAVGVIDRDYSFGSPYLGGVLAGEVRSALYPSPGKKLRCWDSSPDWVAAKSPCRTWKKSRHRFFRLAQVNRSRSRNGLVYVNKSLA